MLAEHLGLKVVGIIGVLLRAKKASLVSSVRPHLDALQAAGFRLADDLYQKALRLADEKDG